MVDTGHTVRLAAGVLKDAGAKEVYALISHGQSICRGILSSY
jgi:ribose-phosphate pyrophosphokinase